VFGPQLLETFALEGSANVNDLLAAFDLIRATYITRKRKVPTAPPLRFVSPRWRPFLVSKGSVDRAAYDPLSHLDWRILSVRY
jgi:hypothetical protein